MMHGFQQIVAQAECRYNFVVHGLAPLGDEMAVSPPIWRKRLMDSISSNLGYGKFRRGGYPLGSGVIESSNTFMCHARLKRSGAWWYEATSNQMLALRNV